MIRKIGNGQAADYLQLYKTAVLTLLKGPEYRDTRLPQPPHTDARVRNCPRYLRSSSAPLPAQPSRRTDSAARGFRYSAPTVWNSLPRTVFDSSSLTVFLNLGLKLTRFTWQTMIDVIWPAPPPPLKLKLPPYGSIEMCVLFLSGAIEVFLLWLWQCSAIAKRPRCRVRYSFRQK